MLQFRQEALVEVGGLAVAADRCDFVVLEGLDEVLDRVRVDEAVAVDANDYLARGLGGSRGEGHPFAIVALVPYQEEAPGELGVLFESLENVPGLVSAPVVDDCYVEFGCGIVAVEHGSHDRFYGLLLVLRRYDYGYFWPVALVYLGMAAAGCCVPEKEDGCDGDGVEPEVSA